MLESWDDGGGLLWGTVMTVAPHKQLQVAGTTFANWGGASMWFGTWDLEETGETTKVQFSESTLGRFSEEQAAGTTRAWRYLFCVALKAHVEGVPAPAWEDSSNLDPGSSRRRAVPRAEEADLARATSGRGWMPAELSMRAFLPVRVGGPPHPSRSG